MLNKEACEKALENLRILERKDNFKKWGGQVAPQISCDIFEQLISEHFDPQPYKFEELKKGMWVWDDKGLYCFECNPAISKNGTRCVTYNSFWYNSGEDEDEFFEEYDEFEEGRFFPVTKAMEHQK